MIILKFISGFRSVATKLLIFNLLVACCADRTMGQNSMQPSKAIGYFKSLDTKPDTVIYKITDGKRLRLLVMRPARAGDQKAPALVWIHGGAWVAGTPEGYTPHLRYSADIGAVGIAVEYRLISAPGKNSDPVNKNTIEDCLADCSDAIKFIRNHADELGIDPKKIIVIGDSAGGHLALCLGTLNLPADAKADVVINCNGISDMRIEKWLKYIPSGPEQAQRAARLSPINFLDSGDVPILTLNGQKDQVVTPEEAETFFVACKKAGIDTEYVLFPDMRHAFIVTNYTATEEQTDRALSAIRAFLVRHNFL